MFVNLFCPYCGDIMQHTRSILFQQNKGAMMVCDDCGKAFWFLPVSDMQLKNTMTRKRMKEAVEKSKK